MKRFEKITLGCAGAVLLGCLFTGALFLFSDDGTAFLGRNSDLVGKGLALSALDREFPSPPSWPASVPEARLEAFLAVACAARGPGDRAAAWVKAHGRNVIFGQTVLPEEGAGLTAAYLDALLAALKAQRMGPAEYLWMGQRLFLVSEGPPRTDRLPELRAALEQLRAHAEESGPDHRQRHELRREIEALEAALGEWAAGEEADWALYQRHADRLRACAPSGRALRLLGEFYSPPQGTVLRFYGEPLGQAGPDEDAPEGEGSEGPGPPPVPAPPATEAPAPTATP